MGIEKEVRIKRFSARGSFRSLPCCSVFAARKRLHLHTKNGSPASESLPIIVACTLGFGEQQKT